jgi:hydrogenase 3 maturation protease
MTLREELEAHLRGRVLIVGVGNVLRGDDGAGPAVVASLAGRVDEEVALLDASEVPENYLGTMTAAQPDSILVVDAVDLGAEPGRAGLLREDQLTTQGGSTHHFPLRLLLQFLREETSAEACLLGLQPARIGPAEELSDPVRAAVPALAGLLVSCLAARPRRPSVVGPGPCHHALSRGEVCRTS